MGTEISQAAVKALVDTLLINDAPAVHVSRTFQQLRAILEEVTGITGYSKDPVHKAQVRAKQGMAININQTVRCFHDERRSLLCLRAVVRAIREQQVQYPGQIIRVCYAGCGPYAPFCTLVAPLFRPTEVQFTLLEINEYALERARYLVDCLDLTSYVQSYQKVDAVTHRFAADERFHILFSETLDAALHRECYVPILLNLLPQLDPSVILIPQNVILRACLVNRASFPQGISDINDPQAIYDEQEIGEVFNVQEALLAYRQTLTTLTTFPPRSFVVPNVFDFDYLVIYTEVQVYQDLWLTRGDSLLTEPLLREVNRVAKGSNLHFSYRLAPSVALQLD